VISASSLPRLFACPGSAALAQARTASQWADVGEENHLEKEVAISLGDYSDLPEKVRDMIPSDATSVRAEVAVAYDVATGAGRELGVGLGRKYGALGPCEIPGTVDLLILAPGRAVIVDWKFYADVGSPADNEQTLLYALAAARAYSLDEVTVAIAYLGEGKQRVPMATLDVLDLDAFASSLQQLHLRVAAQQKRVTDGRMPDVSESRQCRYCPAAHACPAKTALVRRLVSGGEANDLELMVPLNDETARVAYERLGQAKNLLKRIESALYARAAESPIPLGGGRFFGVHKRLGNEQLDGDIVYRVVRDMHGQSVADKAVTREATKKALKESLATVTPKGGVAAAEKAVLEQVRKMGGSKREEKEKVEEFTMLELVDGTEAA
jgi:hypothetical protein